MTAAVLIWLLASGSIVSQVSCLHHKGIVGKSSKSSDFIFSLVSRRDQRVVLINVVFCNRNIIGCSCPYQVDLRSVCCTERKHGCRRRYAIHYSLRTGQWCVGRPTDGIDRPHPIEVGGVCQKVVVEISLWIGTAGSRDNGNQVVAAGTGSGSEKFKFGFVCRTIIPANRDTRL